MAFDRKNIRQLDIKLLYIDDEKESLKFLKSFFNKISPFINIDSAFSSLQALAVLESKSYDIIISNYQMPEIDGLKLLQIIRRKNDNTPFIILTGKFNEEIAIKALNLGADCYVQKMYDPIIFYTELNHLILHVVEKRRYIESLIKAEEHCRALADNSNIGFYQITSNGDIVYLNKAMMEILDVRNINEITNKKQLSLIGSEDLPTIQMEKKQSIENEVFTYKASLTTLSGEKKLGIVSGIPIKDKDGQIESFMGNFTDITDKIYTNEILKEKEYLIDTLTEILPIKIVITRWEDGKILYTNEYTAKSTKSPEKVFFHEEMVNHWSNIANRYEILEVLQKGVKIYTKEIKEKGNDGNDFWVEIFAKEIVYHEEKALLEIIQNITQRKQREIQEEVAKKAEEDKLISERAELSTFAHIMAHDLRNLLSAIEGYALLLKQKNFDETYSDSIQNLTKRSLRFLKKSLDLAEMGQITEKIDKVDLNQIIKICVEVSIPNSINFFSEKLPTVIADQDKVFQIFKNLFENAVVHGQPKDIGIECHIQTENIIILVKNNGYPISPEIKESIENGTTKGLGYKIIYKLIKAHGWDIKLIDIKEPTFEISIPIDQIVKDG